MCRSSVDHERETSRRPWPPAGPIWHLAWAFDGHSSSRAPACFYALVFPFYWWTAVSSGNVRIRDYYNQFTNSILAGHIDMPFRPPKGLRPPKNPYDPALNSTYQRWYHDLILYHGHFYLSWGTTPASPCSFPRCPRGWGHAGQPGGRDLQLRWPVLRGAAVPDDPRPLPARDVTFRSRSR